MSVNRWYHTSVDLPPTLMRQGEMRKDAVRREISPYTLPHKALRC